MAATDSLRLLEQKLDRAISRARTARNVTLIVGALLIVLLLGYFIFMAGMVREAAHPDALADVAIQEAVELVDALPQHSEEFVKKDAPAMVRSFLQNASTTYIPEMRTGLQTELQKRITTELEKHEAEVYVGMDEFLQTYSSNIQELAGELKTPEGTQAFEDSLVAMMEESIASEQIKSDITAYGIALKDIDHLLARVANNEPDLTSEEVALQHLLAVIRESMNRSELNKLNLRETLNVGENEAGKIAEAAAETTSGAAGNGAAKQETQAKGGAAAK